MPFPEHKGRVTAIFPKHAEIEIVSKGVSQRVRVSCPSQPLTIGDKVDVVEETFSPLAITWWGIVFPVLGFCLATVLFFRLTHRWEASLILSTLVLGPYCSLFWLFKAWVKPWFRLK